MRLSPCLALVGLSLLLFQWSVLRLLLDRALHSFAHRSAQQTTTWESAAPETLRRKCNGCTFLTVFALLWGDNKLTHTNTLTHHTHRTHSQSILTPHTHSLTRSLTHSLTHTLVRLRCARRSPPSVVLLRLVCALTAGERERGREGEKKKGEEGGSGGRSSSGGAKGGGRRVTRPSLGVEREPAGRSHWLFFAAALLHSLLPLDRHTHTHTYTHTNSSPPPRLSSPLLFSSTHEQ